MENNLKELNKKPSGLGLYLKKKRIERGLTQSDVAQKLGYGSPQFISNIERGISSVPIKSLKVIVDLYQVPAEEVVEILLSEERRFLCEQLGIKSGSTTSADPLDTTPRMSAPHLQSIG